MVRSIALSANSIRDCASESRVNFLYTLHSNRADDLWTEALYGSDQLESENVRGVLTCDEYAAVVTQQEATEILMREVA